MRVLLDTNVLIWLLLRDTRRISPAAEAVLEDPGNAAFVSSVSHWEIAIKRSLGKLDISQDDWPAAVDRLGFEPLAFSAAHAHAVEHLPVHHGDPFDRALVGQATVENLMIVTPDTQIGRYAVETVW